MAPTLVANVLVDGTWYGPAHGNADQVPSDVAERVTNPKVWAVTDDAPGADEAPDAPVPPVDLDALDRGQLLAHAEHAGIEVNPRLGAAKLRDAIRAATDHMDA